MAKHLAAEQKRKNRKHTMKTKRLPKLLEWKVPDRRVFRYARAFSKGEIAPIIASFVLLLAAWAAPLSPLLKLISYAATAAVAGFSLLRRAVDSILHRRWPDEDSYALFGALFAFLAGHPAVGAMIVILARVLETVEAYVLARSARGMEAIREVLPEKAHVEEEFGLVDVFPEELNSGDIFVVGKGETVPVDGIVLEGSSRIDLSAFGGSSTPAAYKPGDEVLSGGVSMDDVLKLRALRSFDDSALSKHVRSLEKAEDEKTLLEDKIELISSVYSLVMLGLAVLIGVLVPLISGNWQGGLMAASILLLLASPSSLILSVPVIFLGGLSSASHNGIRFTAKRVIEKLFRARTVVFGKTGTITDGHYTVIEVVTERVNRDDLLRVAAAAESGSRHPIAMAIKEAAGWTEAMGASVLEGLEIPGRGVSAFIEGKQVYVGNSGLLEEHGIWFQTPSRAGAAIHVAVDNQYWGHILLNDHIRDGAFDAVEELRSLGLRNVVMLTGDVRSATSKLARSLNFDMVKTDLSPEEKLSAVSFLRKSLGKGETLVYVGDGFHDADMFGSADVGIALNAMGDSRAEDAADVVLMDDDILRVPAVMKIVSDITRLLQENVILLAASKLILLTLALSGLIGALPAVMLNTLCGCLACLNALRSFTIE